MPSDVLYTHPNALICQNKNGGGGPITYQFIILNYNFESQGIIITLSCRLEEAVCFSPVLTQQYDIT